MEILKKGSVEINKLEALGCCWPPGTEDMQMPAPEEAN